jgi:hypothetical protein
MKAPDPVRADETPADGTPPIITDPLHPTP